jgi:hypothetical protein
MTSIARLSLVADALQDHWIVHGVAPLQSEITRFSSGNGKFSARQALRSANSG